jgi:hypothetical protein
MPNPAEPAVPRRKRGPKNKKGGEPPTTLKDLSQQIVEDDPRPADPSDGSEPPPDRKI